MITTTKQIEITVLTEQALAVVPAAAIHGTGGLATTEPKAIGLESEDFSAHPIWIKIDGASPTNTQMQNLIDAHDYTAAVAELQGRRVPKLDKAAWLALLDLLRAQAGVTETNPQFIQRVKTKYDSL